MIILTCTRTEQKIFPTLAARARFFDAHHDTDLNLDLEIDKWTLSTFVTQISWLRHTRVFLLPAENEVSQIIKILSLDHQDLIGKKYIQSRNAKPLSS